MKSLGLNAWILSGGLALGLTACQQKTSENTTPAPAPADAAVTETTTTTTQSADTTAVTADPVVASQRNASRRRARRPAEPPAPAERNAGYDETRAAAPSQHEVPEGTILRVAFDKAISTATAQIGDTISGKLLDDVLAADGTIIARSGGRVVGKIEHVVDSGKLAGQAQLRFRLTEIETRNRKMVPVSTSAYEQIGETHTKRNAGYIAGGAAVGAILGQILGKDTESTLKGAAAGAAVGTGVAAATGDLDFEIEAGRTVAFTLQQSLSLPAAN